jgi:RNA polymerase sigma-70 factor (ECF subfamily)
MVGADAGNPLFRARGTAMNTTPASLLEQLRRLAATPAWNRFVHLYTPLLYTWAWRMGLQDSDAADLVQDVFTLLLQKLPAFEYDRGRSFRAWLRTVTVNRYRETGRRQRPAVGNGMAVAEDLAGPDPTSTFEEAEHRRYLVQRALELMQSDFQPSTWKACWETVVAGRPVGAVAAELGLTVKAVYLARSRVLRRLRQELAGLLD